MKKKYEQLKTGEKYNKWTVIKHVGVNKHGKHTYRCRCECGNESDIENRALILGLSKSCGCARKISKKEKIARRKKYKAEYFQKNKEKIYKRVKLNASIDTDKTKRKNHEYFVKWKYGLTKESFNKLKEESNNKCMICERSFEEVTLCVDHCHETNKIRGLLCKSCNTGIGHFADDITRMEQAIAYLKEKP